MAQVKGAKLSDEEIVGVVNAELATATTEHQHRMSRQREQAMEYYYGEPFGDEQADRSQIVTREVLDTVEWIKPELIKIFASGGETVRFEPQNEGDIETAQQATDYVNYILHRRNRGFSVLYNWITDGLLQKTGVVKVWFDETDTSVRESYKGLSEMELQMLLAPEDMELVASEASEPDAEGLVFFDAEVIRHNAQSGIKIENIPREEFVVARSARTLQDAPVCAHVTRKTISYLNSMGYDTSEIGTGGDSDATLRDSERRARHAYDDADDFMDERSGADDTMREVWVTEAYIRLDADGDGVAELLKVTLVGTTLLDQEEVDLVPFAIWSPIMIPHKLDGLSMADLVMDLQRINSQLFRNVLDNQYLTNNGRYAVLDNMVNMDDMLVSRPHGVVRERVSGAVRRLDTPQLGQSAFQMFALVDQLRERRTGVSERTQGLNENTLNSNTPAVAANQLMTAAQQRIELIARVFGETGLTDLFHLIYKSAIQNPTSKEIFRLRDKYVEVDPSSWQDRKDTSVVVGLGNGSKEMELMNMNLILQNQMMLLGNPQTAPMVAPVNVYNVFEDKVKLLDKTASGRYLSGPESQEYQQAYMEQKKGQQAQQQQMQQFQQMEQQVKQMAVQIQQMSAQAKAENDKKLTQLKEAGVIQDKIEHDDKMELAYDELGAEIQLEATQNRGVALGN